MSTDELWQQIQHGYETYEIQVYPGVAGTQGVPFVLLEDIQDHFPDVSRFVIGSRLVSFMRDTNYVRLKPLRIAYLPGVVVEITASISY
ncbi:hypothetical protein EDD21DRAFT_420170 [Dissophora ornata]|nr:hypothetical protein BGZ58_004213 [Dissophora ornata]KAI8595925.1 hypothetical protein EDD21DRAFT_420170 [Dissophora ornata]